MKQLLNLNVIVDVMALVIAASLAVAVTALSGKSLAKYFVLPITLLAVHVYGNTVQELMLGPEWIRNHLHNTGVAGLSMIAALLFTLFQRQKRYAHLWTDCRRVQTARSAMNEVLYYWIASSLVGAGQEIVVVTIWGDSSKAAGYSGRLDWFDLSAYGIGVLIVTANYLWLKPRIIAEMQRQYGVHA